MVVGLSGAAGTGKDCVARHLRDERGYGIYRMSDPLKDLVCMMFGFDRELIDDLEYKEAADPRWVSGMGIARTRREVLQIIGTEGFRAVDPDYWVKLAERNVQAMVDSGNYKGVVIPDVRFLNEAKMVRHTFHGKVWRLVKRGGPGTDHSGHQSEQEWRHIRVDGTLEAAHGEVDLLMSQAELMLRLSNFGDAI